MKTVVFDGKKFAQQREEELRAKISQFDKPPVLVSIYFREDPASVVYTNLKQKAAGRVGIDFRAENVSVRDDIDVLLKNIRNFSQNRRVHGLMIQKPSQAVFEKLKSQEWANAGVLLTLVKNLAYFFSRDGAGKGSDEWWKRLVMEINPNKDVDCLHTVNLERVYRGKWRILPATVRAILSILEYTGVKLAGKKVVVVGRSEIVGKPLAHVLAQRGALVSLCASTGVVAKSQGKQLISVLSHQSLALALEAAEVVVSASGKPNLITGNMLKQGVVVVDVGSPEGDIDFDSVKRKASFITPVPGGVGPVTVVSLMENLTLLI
jgi:methylenetetrahydrofolate dehydrogenase (NADP+)/methenyltetrahydrofolate cyclohydrolase